MRRTVFSYQEMPNRCILICLKTRCHSEPFAVILSAAKDLALVRDEARTKRSERDSSLRSE